MKTNAQLKAFSIWQNTRLFAGRPREDFFMLDTATGAFVVADGVGLWEGIEYVGRYPKTSGSGRLSRVFCRAFVNHLKSHLRASTRDAFAAGNAAARRVNAGRSKYDVFRKHRGLYAATAATARIRGRKLEWAHICDAGVAVVGADGKIKLQEDACKHHFPWPRDTRGYESSTWTLFARTIVRNAISKNDKLQGYGVVTGEPEAERYLETGTYLLGPNDTVVLYTDGFAPYLMLPEFRKQIAKVETEQELRRITEDFVYRKTARLRRTLSRHRIDGRASVEIIERKLREILGDRFREIEWAKEKSLILIKR